VGRTVWRAIGLFWRARRTGILNVSSVGLPKRSGGPPGGPAPGPVTAGHFTETHKSHTTRNLDSNNLSLQTLRIHGCQGTNSCPTKNETLKDLSPDKMNLTLDTP
jgi:hypothetical protein